MDKNFMLFFICSLFVPVLVAGIIFGTDGIKYGCLLYFIVFVILEVILAINIIMVV